MRRITEKLEDVALGTLAIAITMCVTMSLIGCIIVFIHLIVGSCLV